MNIEPVDTIQLPQADELQVATRIYPELNTMADGKIILEEMKINGDVNPDITGIEAKVDTPVQVYSGDKEIMEMFYSTKDNKPVGVVLMSPEGEVSLKSYNPLKDGGPRGFSIGKGWSMQFIIPEDTSLKFYDYWAPRGYCSPTEGDRHYGWDVLKEVDDPVVLKKFSDARLQLLDYLKRI